MKGYKIQRSSFATDIIASPLLSAKKTFIVSGITALTSFFTGVFFFLCMSGSDAEKLSGPVIQMINSGNGPVASGAAMNIILLFIIMLTGLSVYGAALSFLILSAKALSAGFCTALIYNTMGFSSLTFIILSLIPVSLLRLAVFSAACAISVNYSLSVTRSTDPSANRKHCFAIFAALASVMLFSAFIEQITFRIT